MSAWTCRVTLTYGRDATYGAEPHKHSQLLVYSDVSEYIKRLRWYTEGTVRFLACGEYGTKKGRAHWHLMLFGSNNLPYGVRFNAQKWVHSGPQGRYIWPHGFSYWENNIGPEGIRYVCSYILEDQTGEGHRQMGYSRRPVLGAAYFAFEASKYVKAGLSPQKPYYWFAESRHRDGSPKEYYLSRASRYCFLGEFRKQWVRRYGNDRWPQSELMDKFIDEFDRRQRIDLKMPTWAGGVKDGIDFKTPQEVASGSGSESQSAWIARRRSFKAEST